MSSVQISQPTRYGLPDGTWGGRELRKYGQAPVWQMCVDLGLHSALRQIATKAIGAELDRRGLGWPDRWEIGDMLVDQAVALIREQDSRPADTAIIVIDETIEETGMEVFGG